MAATPTPWRICARASARPAFAKESDGSVEFVELEPGFLTQPGDTLLLLRIGLDQPRQGIELRQGGGASAGEGREIGWLSGEQIAALPGLGIADMAEKALRALPHRDRPRNLIRRVPGLRIDPRRQNDGDRHDADRDNGRRCGS